MGRTLTLVALGDSLTVGFQFPTFDPFWSETAPYTYFLEQRIKDTLRKSGQSNTTTVTVYNKGVNGELTADMLYRFDRDVVGLKPDYVIILGGSNDIGWGIPPKQIFDNLKKMCTKARKCSVEPILCTVPSILGFDVYIPPRLELNRLLKKHCLEAEITCVDLFTATSDHQTNRLLEEYSNDGLHLNTKGYEKVAETVFLEAIQEILLHPR